MDKPKTEDTVAELKLERDSALQIVAKLQQENQFLRHTIVTQEAALSRPVIAVFTSAQAEYMAEQLVKRVLQKGSLVN